MFRLLGLPTALLILAGSGGKVCAVGLPAGGVHTLAANREASAPATMVWDYVRSGEACLTSTAELVDSPLPRPELAAPVAAVDVGASSATPAKDTIFPDEGDSPWSAQWNSAAGSRMPASQTGTGPSRSQDNRIVPDMMHLVSTQQDRPSPDVLREAALLRIGQPPCGGIFRPPRLQG